MMITTTKVVAIMVAMMQVTTDMRARYTQSTMNQIGMISAAMATVINPQTMAMTYKIEMIAIKINTTCTKMMSTAMQSSQLLNS